MNPIYGFVTGHDPITLESFTEKSRIVEFKYNGGSVYYDYDTLSKYILKITRVPHTGELIDLKFKRNFNKICDKFGDKPIYTGLDDKFNVFTMFLYLLGLFLYTCVVAHLLSVYNNNMKILENMKN
jgi:hypothetical protein